tara:strand:+ start:1004 stop:1435 length:432 start_codon:yes stop_codon:yes gene_type:complete
MEKLITLFLTLGLAQSLQSASLEVDIPWDYKQIKADALLIQQYNDSQKIDFKLTDNKHIYKWVAWNIADVYTTDRAISGGYAREMNPFLPDYPSLERIIAQKLLVNFALYKIGFFEDPDTVNQVNKFGWLIVANNTWIIIDNE